MTSGTRISPRTCHCIKSPPRLQLSAAMCAFADYSVFCLRNKPFFSFAVFAGNFFGSPNSVVRGSDQEASAGAAQATVATMTDPTIAWGCWGEVTDPSEGEGTDAGDGRGRFIRPQTVAAAERPARASRGRKNQSSFDENSYSDQHRQLDDLAGEIDRDGSVLRPVAPLATRCRRSDAPTTGRTWQLALGAFLG